jgi:hypothetical protein
MSVNRANDSITNDSLAKQVADLQREVIANKSTQIVGADTIDTRESDEQEVTITIGAGTTAWLPFHWYADPKRKYLSEMKVGLYVGVDNDPDHSWPLGNALTPGNFVIHGPFLDLLLSDELGNGNKTYTVGIENKSGSSQTCYVHTRLIFPGQTLTAGL